MVRRNGWGIPGGISYGLERKRLCRGPQRGDRIPLGAIRQRPAVGTGGRSRPPPGVRDRHAVSTPAALAAKAATGTIPIVFGIGTDPVQTGLVASLNRPGGNVTGVSAVNVELTAKRLGLLHELIPRADGFAALVSPNDPNAEAFTSDARSAAAAIGRGIEIFSASSHQDIDIAFASLVRRKLSALIVSPDAMFLARRVQLIGLSLRHAVATIYPWREAIEIGGLMSYGSSFTEIFRQVGIYTSRILKGENPTDFPVLRASKFEFVINLQTAKTLGIHAANAARQRRRGD